MTEYQPSPIEEDEYCLDFVEPNLCGYAGECPHKTAQKTCEMSFGDD